MKKILIILLAVISILTIAGCCENYRTVEVYDENHEVIQTIEKVTYVENNKTYVYISAGDEKYVFYGNDIKIIFDK